MGLGAIARRIADPGNPTELTVTILNTASLSEELDLLGHGVLVGLHMPAAWTAAVITFQCSGGGTVGDFYKADGTEYQLTVDVDQHILLDPSDFAGIRKLKVRSGTGAAPQAQGGDRVITLIVRPV